MKDPNLSPGVTFAAVSAANIAIVVAGVPPKACALPSAAAGVYSAAKGRPWWSLLYFASAYVSLAGAAYLEEFQRRQQRATTPQQPAELPPSNSTIAGIRSASAAERHRRAVRRRR